MLPEPIKKRKEVGSWSGTSGYYDELFWSPATKDTFMNVTSYRPFIKERGLELTNFDAGRSIVRDRQWEKLCDAPQGAAKGIVQEFYANLANLPRWAGDSLFLRGKQVSFSPNTINTLFGLVDINAGNEFHKWRLHKHNLDEIEATVCRKNKKPTWKTGLDCQLSFQSHFLNDESYIWFMFISTRLLPSTNLLEIAKDQALLVYAIQKGIPIDIGRLIYTQIRQCARMGAQDGLCFPHLITELCTAHGVFYNVRDDIMWPDVIVCNRPTTSSCSAKCHLTPCVRPSISSPMMQPDPACPPPKLLGSKL